MKTELMMAAVVAIGAVASAAERLDLTWPTPNPAWAEGKAIGDFVQHAGSGDPVSGTFGGCATVECNFTRGSTSAP